MTPSAGRSGAAEDDDVHAASMFTFMFLWSPSGLVIYWFVSNLWAIGQQYLTNWMIGPPRLRRSAAAAADGRK